jgi:hypothetical protein
MHGNPLLALFGINLGHDLIVLAVIRFGVSVITVDNNRPRIRNGLFAIVAKPASPS